MMSLPLSGATNRLNIMTVLEPSVLPLTAGGLLGLMSFIWLKNSQNRKRF
jgi:hypothetical protein